MEAQKIRPSEPVKIHPAIDWVDKEPSKQEWIVEDLVPINQVTMISGEGGSGKSMLMLQLCACCATGSWWLDEPTLSCPAWYLSCEDDGNTLHERMSGILKSIGMEFIDLEDLRIYDYVSGGSPSISDWGRHTDWEVRLNSQFVQIVLEAKEAGVQLLVLDSRYDVFEGNENDRKVVRQFVRMLRRVAHHLNGAVVVIDHPSKDGIKTGDGTSGSTAWHNAVRSRLYMATNPDSGEMEIHHKKSNYGKRRGPIPVEYCDGAFRKIGGKPWPFEPSKGWQ